MKPLSGGMLHFQINPHSGVPVYRQMIDQVKYYVASDALKAGDQLPSIRELAQSLAINPTTVVHYPGIAYGTTGRTLGTAYNESDTMVADLLDGSR